MSPRARTIIGWLLIVTYFLMACIVIVLVGP